MRYLLLLLVASACFSEASSPANDCPSGMPGCDCRTDGTCDDALECVTSIDKCVPPDCTPGTNTCTCDASTCDAPLVCTGGVCSDPAADTTGMITNAGTAPSTTSADASATEISTSLTAEGSATSTMSETLDTSASETMSTASDTATIPCPACLGDAATGACMSEYEICTGSLLPNGCNPLQDCVIQEGGNIDACCAENNADEAYALWAEFVSCAMANECAGECGLFCAG